MKLTDSLEDTVTINGKDYLIDMSFDNVLRFYELFEDKEIGNHEKIEYMFEMLIFDSKEIDLDLLQKREVIEKIIATHMSQEEIVDDNVEDMDEDNPEATHEEPAKKEYDLTIDAGLIYSSFVYDYKIDLFEQQGKLHWRKFIALLNGLSEDSPFMKVIHIRTCEIPQPNKHNTKDRLKLMKLKRHYSLEKQDVQTGLNRAASFLRGKAKEKVGENKI